MKNIWGYLYIISIILVTISQQAVAICLSEQYKMLSLDIRHSMIRPYETCINNQMQQQYDQTFHQCLENRQNIDSYNACSTIAGNHIISKKNKALFHQKCAELKPSKEKINTNIEKLSKKFKINKFCE